MVILGSDGFGKKWKYRHKTHDSTSTYKIGVTIYSVLMDDVTLYVLAESVL